jgi:hypothetical protein
MIAVLNVNLSFFLRISTDAIPRRNTDDHKGHSFHSQQKKNGEKRWELFLTGLSNIHGVKKTGTILKKSITVGH